MIDLVVDANVVLAWIRAEDEPLTAQATSVRDAFHRGQVGLVVPPLTAYEVLNVAGRKWRWPADALDRLVAELFALGLETVEPPLSEVARWTATGLSAYDAAYVAVAEQTGATLVTGDAAIVSRAPGRAHPLAEVEALLAGAAPAPG
ncbi:PIN domain-containing protein [Conexibacter sp. JD483]|uniref:PIN domain-containing protein n=1 Tax=unclassified Conexibacter TaxID=2627773 RepID=UPI002723DE81|nr:MULTISPECIES: PIN domain-containing protein [unclassified Conexibacter]MDO8186306.1 PIN domain-containing protein [Conexibacter sp. CPCC 205706]MDO8197511.1 PIN domain-containing protein [Conexibacter sp. CPCC 205762]MDR9370294.1 PIN domain-containing protein [Conexibacter sp. JD483]